MRFNRVSNYALNAWRRELHPLDPEYEDGPTEDEVAQGERELDDYLMRESDDGRQDAGRV